MKDTIWADGISGWTLRATNNCFSVETANADVYRIVNFYVEDLHQLLREGLSFPIGVRPLDARYGLLYDPRIDARWYRQEYCQICCPADFWTVRQKARWEARKARGEIIERPGGWTRIFPRTEILTGTFRVK